MKNFTLLLVAFLGLSLASQAQRITDVYTFEQTPQDLSAAEAEAMRGTGESALEVAQRGGGTILFYEDFANGFEGNNGIGAWTSEDTGEGLIWQAVDAAGNGYYADGSASGVQPPAG